MVCSSNLCQWNVPRCDERKGAAVGIFSTHHVIIPITYQIDTKSELQGFQDSRLPVFTAEESVEILGSWDFLGIDFYSSRLVYPEPGDISEPSYYEDKDVSDYPDMNWYT